jgi:hypothetical protein
VFRTAVEPLLDAALADGVDATVFAYGQTGSGKTHTIEDGMVPRAVRHIFDRASQVDGVRATFVELYNGVLYDLFGGSGRKCALAEVGGAFELRGARVVAAANPEDLLREYSAAVNQRSTAGTAMNSRSSRSHAVLSMTVGSPNQQPRAAQGRDAPVTVHIVDLAGSERLKRSKSEGTARGEAIAINSSLLALARVVHALVTTNKIPAAHIPYRGSMLTKMLSNAIGGRARTVLIACIAPSADSREETISTLRFSTCASLVRNRIDKEAEAKNVRRKPAASLSSRVQLTLAERAATFAEDSFQDGPLTVRVGKGAAEIEVWGDFSAGHTAPLCVMLHYYGHGSAGGAQFQPWFGAVRAAGFRCLAPSFPGHGGSLGTISSKPDPDVLARGPCALLLEILDHFGASRVVIYGYDWGGGVGLELALQRSERVTAVMANCASYRDEARLRLLKEQGFRKRRLAFLGRKSSQVHLWSKTVKQARAAGVDPIMVGAGCAVEALWVDFLKMTAKRTPRRTVAGQSNSER